MADVQKLLKSKIIHISLCLSRSKIKAGESLFDYRISYAYSFLLYRVKAEVDAVIGDKDVITYEDTTKLEYINQVLKETLRLYPPAPGTSRDTPEEVTVDGYRLPKGSTIIVSIQSQQNMPLNRSIHNLTK